MISHSGLKSPAAYVGLLAVGGGPLQLPPATTRTQKPTLPACSDGQIHRADPTPLHDQVAAQIRRSIAEGDAKPGDRLPPARDVAAVLGVNTN